MKPYEKMTKREAAAALEEFLEERPRALEHLSRTLAARAGENINLDGTVESLVPLCAWVKSVLTERTTDIAESDTSTSPSWVRYGIGIEPTLSPESVAVVDGVTSYLCQIVQRGTAGAEWRVGYHRIKSYIWQNRPVLVCDGEEIALAEIVPGAARGQVSGRVSSADDELARTAVAAIKRLNGANDEMVGEAEPLIEVEDLGEDRLRGRELEVSLHEEIAHEYSRQVDRMVKKLAKEDGIIGVIREDREVLLVATPAWNTTQLEEWVTRYLKDHIRELNAPGA